MAAPAGTKAPVAYSAAEGGVSVTVTLTAHTILMAGAVVLFVLGAFRASKRVDFVALGLACFAGSFLVG